MIVWICYVWWRCPNVPIMKQNKNCLIWQPASQNSVAWEPKGSNRNFWENLGDIRHCWLFAICNQMYPWMCWNSRHTEEFTEYVEHNFNVNDIMNDADNINSNELKRFQSSLIETLQKRQCDHRKWTSRESSVMEDVPPEKCKGAHSAFFQRQWLNRTTCHRWRCKKRQVHFYSQSFQRRSNW